MLLILDPLVLFKLFLVFIGNLKKNPKVSFNLIIDEQYPKTKLVQSLYYNLH